MRNWRTSVSICGWGQEDERRTIHSILRVAGGGVVAERLTAVRVGVGVVAVRKAGAAMSAALGTIYGEKQQ